MGRRRDGASGAASSAFGVEERTTGAPRPGRRRPRPQRLSCCPALSAQQQRTAMGSDGRTAGEGGKGGVGSRWRLRKQGVGGGARRLLTRHGPGGGRRRGKAVWPLPKARATPGANPPRRGPAPRLVPTRRGGNEGGGKGVGNHRNPPPLAWSVGRDRGAPPCAPPPATAARNGGAGRGGTAARPHARRTEGTGFWRRRPPPARPACTTPAHPPTSTAAYRPPARRVRLWGRWANPPHSPARPLSSRLPARHASWRPPSPPHSARQLGGGCRRKIGRAAGGEGRNAPLQKKSMVAG